MKKSELTVMLQNMISAAGNARDIGDSICEALDGCLDDRIFDALNQIQDCEIVSVEEALEAFDDVKFDQEE